MHKKSTANDITNIRIAQINSKDYYIVTKYTLKLKKIRSIIHIIIKRRSAFMKEILNKIMELDKIEHNMIEEAEEIRNSALEDIESRKEELKEEYLNKALSDAEKKNEKAMELANEELKISDDETEKAILELEKNFNAEKDKYLKDILDRMTK
jgi:hypothetical protein